MQGCEMCRCLGGPQDVERGHPCPNVSEALHMASHVRVAMVS